MERTNNFCRGNALCLPRIDEGYPHFDFAQCKQAAFLCGGNPRIKKRQDSEKCVLGVSPSEANTVRLIDSIVRIAPCLVAIICAGEPRPYRAAKSPNSVGLLSILLPQNCGWNRAEVSSACVPPSRGLACSTEPYCK